MPDLGKKPVAKSLTRNATKFSMIIYWNYVTRTDEFFSHMMKYLTVKRISFKDGKTKKKCYHYKKMNDLNDQ